MSKFKNLCEKYKITIESLELGLDVVVRGINNLRNRDVIMAIIDLLATGDIDREEGWQIGINF